MEKVRDYNGREICAGDIIVYPVRQSSSMWMETALVTEIEHVPSNWNAKKIVPRLVVQKVSAEYSDVCPSRNSVHLRKSLITAIDRVVVITEIANPKIKHAFFGVDYEE